MQSLLEPSGQTPSKKGGCYSFAALPHSLNYKQLVGVSITAAEPTFYSHCQHGSFGICALQGPLSHI